MTNPIWRTRGVNRRALHLLWTIPLAVFLCIPLVLVATISLCGISGCTGGGFGVSTDDQSLTWLLCAVVGLIFVAAVGIPAWLYPRTARIIVAIAVGAGISGVLVANYVSQLQYLPH